jgi:hypothetical protein
MKEPEWDWQFAKRSWIIIMGSLPLMVNPAKAQNSVVISHRLTSRCCPNTKIARLYITYGYTSALLHFAGK